MYNQIHKFKKTTLKKLSPLRNQQGFTFLEIIVVITIMGFLVSMTIPTIGHISKVQRIKATEKKLEEIKTAIIGKQDVFDDKGLPVVKGYVGDIGKLPKLYQSVIDDNTGKWKWTITEKSSDGAGNTLEREVIKTIDSAIEKDKHRGHPIGLWTKNWGSDAESAKEDEKEDLGEKWKGPYISYPKPMYADSTKNLDPKKDEELYKQKQTEGKLIDGWGRVVYFIKEYEKYEEYKEGEVKKKKGIESTATLLIISGGPDGKVELPNPNKDDPERDERYSDVADHEDNKDNIVIKIAPNEWYEAYNEGKEQETKEQLEEIRDALIGSFKATDETGRKRIGGYIGDMGEWPVLYKPRGDSWSKLSEKSSELGQPIGLWKNLLKEKILEDEDEKSIWKLWEGPYISAPWGDEIKDSWGNKLKFEIIKSKDKDTNIEIEKTMKVTSAGIDGRFSTKDNISEDDLLIIVDLNEWKKEKKETTINDEKKIKETKKILEDIRTALLGSKDARDATGRRIVGGYLADMGKWPGLYEVKNGKLSEDEITDYEKKWGQPINLWTMETWKKDDEISIGFEWRGVYLSNPYKALLKDSWGNPIKFELNDNSENATIMTITSAGIDGEFDKLDESNKSDDSDDIKITIDKSEWQTTVVLKGTIYNNLGENTTPISVTVELFDQNNNSVSKKIDVDPIQVEERGDGENKTRKITGGGQVGFTIISDNTILGLRKLRVYETKTRENGLDEEVDIFIGEGGTQSPSSDKLNFFIK